jgi:hypothetical protein
MMHCGVPSLGLGEVFEFEEKYEVIGSYDGLARIVPRIAIAP